MIPRIVTAWHGRSTAVRLWRCGLNTKEIADRMRLRESIIYNRLEIIKQLAGAPQK